VRWQLVPGEHCFVAEMRDVDGSSIQTTPLCVQVLEAMAGSGD